MKGSATVLFASLAFVFFILATLTHRALALDGRHHPRTGHLCELRHPLHPIHHRHGAHRFQHVVDMAECLTEIRLVLRLSPSASRHTSPA